MYTAVTVLKKQLDAGQGLLKIVSSKLQNFLLKNKFGFIFILVVVCLFLYRIFLGYSFFPGDIIYQWPPWSYTNPAILSKILPIHNRLLGDPVTAFFPWHYFMKVAFSGGFFPLWNPYILCGAPLFANWQSGVLDPINIFFYVTSPALALNIVAFFKLFLAGVFMYLFLKQYRLSHKASVFGACVYIFSAFFINWLNWPHTSVAIWLPLILLFGERIIRNGNYLDCMGLSLALAFLIFAGHPGSTVQSFLLLGIYCLARLYQVRGQEVLKKFFLFILAVFVSLLLAAIFLVPGVEFMKLTYQYEARTASGYTSNGLPLTSVVLMIFPFLFGNLKDGFWTGLYRYNFIEMSTYMGLLTPYLVFLAVSTRKLLKEHLAFVIVSLYSLLLIFSLAIGKILYKIPIFATQPPQRFVYTLTFAFAYLAAVGFDQLFLEEKTNLRMAAGIGLINVGAIALFIKFALTLQNLRAVLSIYRFQFMLVILATILLTLRYLMKIPKEWLKNAFLVFLVADLFLFGVNLNSYIKKDYVYPPTTITNYIKKDKSLFRVLPLSNVMSPNIPMVYGFYDVRGRDALLIKRYADFATTITDFNVPPQLPNFIMPNMINSKLMDFLNVKYVINTSDINITQPVIIKADRFQDIKRRNVYGQSFVATENDLAEIDYLVGTFGNVVNIPIKYHLYEKQKGQWVEIRSAKADTDRFRDNTYAIYLFEPIKNSKGKTYLFTFETPTATKSRKVAAYYNSDPFIEGGSRYENGYKKKGSYALMPRYLKPTDRYKLVYYEKDLSVYQNTKVMPRAYMAFNYKVISIGGKILEELKSNFDYQTPIIEKEPKYFGAIKNYEGKALTQIKKYKPQEIKIKVSTPKKGLLLLSDTYYPGWNVYVDGKKAEIFRANYAFRAVPLNKGKHTVIFSYEPVSFRVGFFISIMTLFFVIASSVLFVIKRKKS
ncbi:MAG: hypothetical protein C4562_01860 [Actinobacteria bacterium]|nr:MAG: hypothetical protein C4562_01860 [Actinomycetota bacterium]